LIAKGLKFTSETDTEVIAKLVGLYLDEKMDTKNALKYALNRSLPPSSPSLSLSPDPLPCRCEGTWGIAIVNKESPDEIVVACNGSPMVSPLSLPCSPHASPCSQVIGLGNGKTFIASETSAFSKYTKNFIAMKDGEIGLLSPTHNSLLLTRLPSLTLFLSLSLRCGEVWRHLS
jgi:glutamine---fructose-6-phosphate transaminase (isomerizing)